jgi:hypothetical protein
MPPRRKSSTNVTRRGVARQQRYGAGASCRPSRTILRCDAYRIRMEREDIQARIRTAFAGVRLGAGVSLREAQRIDWTILGIRQDQRDLPPEVTDDWTRVPDAELMRDCVAHLDADGLRYYLPALMLWLLDHYDDDDRLFIDGADMTAIGTMSALAPWQKFAQSYWDIYDKFTSAQRSAIASYVDALPRLVHLDKEDATLVERSLTRYWERFLSTS